MSELNVLSLIPADDAAYKSLHDTVNITVKDAADVEKAIEEMQRLPFDIIISHQSLSPADQNKLNKMRLNLLPDSELLEYFTVNAKHLQDDLQILLSKIEAKRNGPKLRIVDGPEFY